MIFYNKLHDEVKSEVTYKIEDAWLALVSSVHGSGYVSTSHYVILVYTYFKEEKSLKIEKERVEQINYHDIGDARIAFITKKTLSRVNWWVLFSFNGDESMETKISFPINFKLDFLQNQEGGVKKVA